MTGDIDVIHHPGLIVRDIDAAVASYEKLGFVLTPLSMHRIATGPNKEPVYFGVGNRNAIFEKNFLEIVGVIDPKRWSEITKPQRGAFDIDERLALYEGLHILHFGADDLEVVRKRFAHQGIQHSDISRVERPVDTPSGQQLMRALAMHYAKDANPEGLMQIAQHLTPEVALQPRYIRHANGARLLTEVMICTPDPTASAAKYAAYVGRAAERRAQLQVLTLPHSRVVFVDPETMQRMIPGYLPPRLPFLAGITVATHSMATAHNLLRGNGIEVIDDGSRFIVSPRDACGCAVTFEEIGSTR
jgi:catechol 2,3-dioxygenase-like lactoylglutathione lyase family enzyme